MHYKKLYKRTATQAIQVWWQECVADRYRTHSGQHEGQIVTSEWTVAVPKNVGRSNETTAEQQAVLEVEANYELKRKKGYLDRIDTARTAERFSPMLAKEYGDYKKDVDKAYAQGAIWVQPKLDGVRCIATAWGLFSRAGNPIVAVPHIAAALESFFAVNPDVTLDGELYTHDLRDDFPRLVSLVRKTKPTENDVEEAKAVEFWAYDLVLGQSPGAVFTERYRILEQVVNEVREQWSYVCLVPTLSISDNEELDWMYHQFLENGFEGAMIRLDTPYEQKRSKNLLKLKETKDDEFTVLEICEGVGNRSGMAGYARLLLPSGQEFKANIKGDRASLRELLLHRTEYVGKQATVEFFHYTPDGIPRFPRVKIFHSEQRL